MRFVMKDMLKMVTCLLVLVFISACEMSSAPEESAMLADDDFERGPNDGRMLREGDFAVELAIFETGVPPEFRAWVTDDEKPIDAGAVNISVTLERLGGSDEIAFEPRGEYLRGDQVVYEPHSFAVAIDASYRGRRYHWEYESFEGRTRILPEMADAFGIATGIAGPATIEETILVYGIIVANAERVREVSARFNGAIRSVDVALGDTVRQGQRLATVESNESLQSYAIDAPIAGIVMERTANAGEQTNGRRLFTIVDTTSVWAELAVFPGDRNRVAVGQGVKITPATGGDEVSGRISLISPIANANQSVSARVTLDNSDGRWAPGTYVSGTISIAEFDVPLAVRRAGLQSFRDFTVVYAQFGDQYEVRMLDLGREDDEWAEVLGGLEPGTRYVTTNSYVLKADIEKSGATHDH
jgi:cobalt-zinc-cadmium efflux system membrane fusion protein